jgi:hypothetical protein
MEEGFYKLNNEVLKFDLNKDLGKIRFNHYICRKENLQRSNGKLPRGQFYMTINGISNDLQVTFAEARGLIRKFIKIGIITNIYTPPKGCKNPSIWQYNSVIFTNNDDNNDDNNEKHSNINGCMDTTNNENSNDINNSKKENIKRKYKKDNNIIVQQAEQLWGLYPYKTGKARVINKIPKIIEKEGYEQLKRCIERYLGHVESRRNKGFKDLSYQNGSTFFNTGYVDYLDKNYTEVIKDNTKALKNEKTKPNKMRGWDDKE